MDLETALQWTLSCNSTVIAARQNIHVSAAALAVARRFPTSLNPTLSVSYCPWVFERLPEDGVHRLKEFVNVTWGQPIELGHRQGYRVEMGQAAYSQTQWTSLLTELTALVQTYRVHQTATYRRQKLALAQQLADFNTNLLGALRRQFEANLAPPADLVLAEVENQATAQQLEVARLEYAAALVELRQQINVPQWAASAEPAGDLRAPAEGLPGDEAAMLRLALAGRPEVHEAEAAVANARAALRLARANRIPIPSIGPTYERNETGASFYGVAVTTPVPMFNAGGPMVRQREAELHRECVALEQARQQVTVQVRAVLAKWNQAQRSAAATHQRWAPVRTQSERMTRLYEAGQADLVKLLQFRQRLIEAENAQLDAVWQVTQAYADLLTALGATPLVGAAPVR
jgi:cobalt-zinc-cadmium efflux system outer membrane protein